MNFGEYDTLAWISGLLPSISVLTIAFMPAPPNTILMSLALGLLDRLQHADGHVVVGRPDGVDLLEARQVVLHHLEGVVAVPVAVLGVEHLDVRDASSSPP